MLTDLHFDFFGIDLQSEITFQPPQRALSIKTEDAIVMTIVNSEKCSRRRHSIGTDLFRCYTSNCCTMVCPTVRGDNPQASANRKRRYIMTLGF